MKLIFLHDEEILFDGEVSEVTIETPNGPMTILPGHEPYLTKISGKVSYKQDGKTEISEEISEGFVYTNGEKCFVVVDGKIR